MWRQGHASGSIPRSRRRPDRSCPTDPADAGSGDSAGLDRQITPRAKGTVLEGIPPVVPVHEAAEVAERTSKLRREAGSAAAAIEDGRFRASLYETLHAWGIGRRGSKMVSRSEFDSILLGREDAIAGLDDVAVGTPEAAETREALWALISSLGIVENDAPLVAHTKIIDNAAVGFVLAEGVKVT